MGDPVPSSAISDATTGGLSVIVITGGSTGDVLVKQSDGTYAAATLSKSSVGLGNVDNTSDANKPVSSAQQTALDAKQATLVSGTNIKTINSTSLLGSGDITVSASPGGSSGQVQYNNAGAFGGMTAVVYAGTGTHVAITSQAAATIPLCVKGAASQIGNLTEWQNSSGTILFRVDSAGNLQLPSAGSTYVGTDGANFVFSTSSHITAFRGGNPWSSQHLGSTHQGSYLLRNNASSAGFGWGTPVAALVDSPDTKISRNASGVVEINNGTAGTFRDLIVRNLRMSAPTLVPASASATGSEGQIAWDANYIYVCTSANTWKRVAIATW